MSSKFVFDETLCTGCFACETACHIWHERSASELGYRQVQLSEQGSFPSVTRIFKSVALPGCDLCKSCGGTPHCALTCPTGALRYC